MGKFLNFKDYSLEAIKRKPQRFKTTVANKKFVFEISYNRATGGLSLGIYDEFGEKLFSKIPITANINLASTIPAKNWPPEVLIWGQWVKPPTTPIAEAFMRDFKIYLGGS